MFALRTASRQTAAGGLTLASRSHLGAASAASRLTQARLHSTQPVADEDGNLHRPETSQVRNLARAPQPVASGFVLVQSRECLA